MRKAILAGVALFAATIASQASATTLIQGFEAPPLTGGGYAYLYAKDQKSHSFGSYVSNTPTLTFSGMAGIQKNGSNFHFLPATDGVQTAFVQTFNTAAAGKPENDITGSFSITLTGLTSGKTYKIAFMDLGRLPKYAGAADFSVSDNGSTTQDYGAPSAAAWRSDYYQFKAGSTNVLTFSSLLPSVLKDGTIIGGSTAIDSIEFASVVPEPATWTLMMVGVFGIGIALRTNRRRGVAVAA